MFILLPEVIDFMYGVVGAYPRSAAKLNVRSHRLMTVAAYLRFLTTSLLENLQVLRNLTFGALAKDCHLLAALGRQTFL